MASVLAALFRRLRMPYGIGLIIAAIVLTLIPFDSNLEISRKLLFTVFLPPLVFTPAFQLRWPELRNDLPVVLSLATAGILLSAAATTLGMHYLADFNWTSAALFGGLIAASDPLSVIEAFEKEGFIAQFEQSGEAALAALNSYKPDVVVSDIRMKSRNEGLNLLAHLHEACPTTPVILMTAFGSMDTAVRAVREGAFDYISKPFLMEQVVSTVRRALAVSPSVKIPVAEEDEDSSVGVTLIGRNPAMLEIYKTIGRVADAQAPRDMVS
jgi:CheY-like chemotaxis protein